MKTSLALILPLLLAACGGGGSDASETPPPCRATVQLMGDSTTFQQGGLLQEYVDSALGKGVASVVNSGVGSTTAAQLPERIPGAILVIGFGINDVGRLALPDFSARLAATRADVYVTPVRVTELDNAAYAEAVREVAVSQRKALADVFKATLPLVDGVHPSLEGYRTLVGITGPVVIETIKARCK